MCIIRYIVIIGVMLPIKMMCGDVSFSEIMPPPLSHELRQCSVQKEIPKNFEGTNLTSIHSVPKNKPIPKRQIFSWDKWTPIQISFFYIKLFCTAHMRQWWTILSKSY